MKGKITLDMIIKLKRTFWSCKTKEQFTVAKNYFRLARNHYHWTTTEFADVVGEKINTMIRLKEK